MTQERFVLLCVTVMLLYLATSLWIGRYEAYPARYGDGVYVLDRWTGNVDLQRFDEEVTP